MNFVVGVILIGIVDPSGDGFGSDESRNESILQFAMTYVSLFILSLIGCFFDE